jgi:ATP-binding cassette subfamily C (CFTR/MRP) protein 4
MNFDLKHDSLLMVAGKIGSGKTTLLFSIMEENRRIKGSLDIRGKIAYVEQEPFIFSSTVEDNITFGLEYNDERFKKCIDAACLEADMELLSNGQKTIIGERGINVSGGQKARISLARAIYQDADIYLLDDPLSAVDPEVANNIFEKAILGALRNKCVVLVTHQLQFMRRCQQIMILQDGEQRLIGTYDELLKQGFDADEIM